MGDATASADGATLPVLATDGSARRPEEVLRIAHRAVELRGPDPDRASAAVRSEGAHLVEVDIRVTGDEQLVVAHDPWVTDAQRGRRWIADLRLDEIVGQDDRISPAYSVLAAIRRCGMGVYLDIKSITPAAMAALSATLRAAGVLEACIVASSRSDIVAMSAELLPGAIRSVLFASDTEDPVQLATSVDAHYVHPCWERFPSPQGLLTTAWIRRVRQRGLGIISWHEERPDVLADLVSMGVDGICTDDIPLLVASVAATSTDGFPSPGIDG